MDFKFSLKNQIQVRFSLMIILVLFLFSIVMVLYFANVLTRNAENYSKEIITSTSREVDHYLLQILSLMKVAAESDVIRSASERSKAGYAWRAVDFLQNLALDHPEIRDIILLNKVGYSVIGTGKPVRQDYNFYQQTWISLKGRVLKDAFFLDPHNEDYYTRGGGDNEVVSIILPIKTGDNQNLHTESAGILCNLNIIELKNLTRYMIPVKNSSIMIYDIEGKPIFDDLKGLNSDDQSIDGAELFARNGEYMLVQTVSALTGWHLAAFLPQKEILRDLNLLIYIFILGTVFAIIITLLIAARLSMKISQPLEEMAGRMKEIGQGNFYLGLSDIEATTELLALGKSIDSMIHHINHYQESIRETQLFALQEQINPHFLFNTLQSIKSLTIDNRGEDIRKITTVLGEILRYGMYNPWELVPLKEELDFVEKFLTIQSYRFPDQFTYGIECPEDLARVPILKLLIQPIVENSIIHGFEGKIKKKIDITVARETGGVAILITDNGKGISQEKLTEIKEGLRDSPRKRSSKIGLKNVQERINLQFGQHFGLEITSSTGCGCSVFLHLPEGNSN
ncbi:MAG: histidine kinase [Spirochaetales bacterium]|nr:histidine kinase [Spirochaetales bacterium]